MIPEALYNKLAALADGVVVDKTWQDQSDDLGVSVLGMLLYGYALGTGRLIMLLDIEESPRPGRPSSSAAIGTARARASA